MTEDRNRNAGKSKSADARTRTTSRDDGKFVRTAVVIPCQGSPGSVDLVDPDGQLLVRVNVSLLRQPDGETLIVDVIDVAERYVERKAIGFSRSERTTLDVPKGGTLVSVDFRRPA